MIPRKINLFFFLKSLNNGSSEFFFANFILLNLKIDSAIIAYCRYEHQTQSKDRAFTQFDLIY